MSQQDDLRAEVAELRKLVTQLLAQGVTITHVHTVAPVSPYLPTYPRPFPVSPYPWVAPQGPTCISVCSGQPTYSYNGDCPQ